jgi:hypothetical protein
MSRRNRGTPSDTLEVAEVCSRIPYVAPHTAKIHTLITLGIRRRIKPLALRARMNRPCGFIPIARSTSRLASGYVGIRDWGQHV